MANLNEPTTVWTGQHLSMLSRSGWEYVSRNTQKPAVGIVAVTDDRRIVLVEQYRPPIQRNIIELPAGLVGDIAGAEHEVFVEAAKRELLEETGYVATRWTELGSGYSSPGLTDESIVLFLAEDLLKRGPGGGDESEAITIHEVPLNGVDKWLAEQHGSVDLKLLAGLFAAQSHLASRENRND